jgi:hypothetical protein
VLFTILHDQRVSEELKKMESSARVLKNEEMGPLEISGSIRLVLIHDIVVFDVVSGDLLD